MQRGEISNFAELAGFCRGGYMDTSGSPTIRERANPWTLRRLSTLKLSNLAFPFVNFGFGLRDLHSPHTFRVFR